MQMMQQQWFCARNAQSGDEWGCLTPLFGKVSNDKRIFPYCC